MMTINIRKIKNMSIKKKKRHIINLIIVIF